MDHFAVAVGAFNPTEVLRDLQPNARVAKRALIAITGHAVLLDYTCFRGVYCHDALSLVVAGRRPL
jgi:hypothetical protein